MEHAAYTSEIVVIDDNCILVGDAMGNVHTLSSDFRVLEKCWFDSIKMTSKNTFDAATEFFISQIEYCEYSGKTVFLSESNSSIKIWNHLDLQVIEEFMHLHEPSGICIDGETILVLSASGRLFRVSLSDKKILQNSILLSADDSSIARTVKVDHERQIIFVGCSTKILLLHPSSLSIVKEIKIASYPEDILDIEPLKSGHLVVSGEGGFSVFNLKTDAVVQEYVKEDCVARCVIKLPSPFGFGVILPTNAVDFSGPPQESVMHTKVGRVTFQGDIISAAWDSYQNRLLYALYGVESPKLEGIYLKDLKTDPLG